MRNELSFVSWNSRICTNNCVSIVKSTFARLYIYFIYVFFFFYTFSVLYNRPYESSSFHFYFGVKFCTCSHQFTNKRARERASVCSVCVCVWFVYIYIPIYRGNLLDRCIISDVFPASISELLRPTDKTLFASVENMAEIMKRSNICFILVASKI